MTRRTLSALTLAVALFCFMTVPANGDCASAAASAPKYVQFFVEAMRDPAVVTADARGVPFAVQNLAWKNVVFVRAYQELANRGIVAPSADERCLRDACLHRLRVSRRFSRS